MVTIAVAADHLGMSERNFKTLLDTSVIKRAERSNYDLRTVTHAYVKHLRDVKQGIEGGGKSKLSDARARSATANATRAEFDLEVSQGKWCLAEDVVKQAIIEIVLIRENFLSAPGKIADPLHQVDREEAFHIVDDEIRECLGRLASGTGGIEFAVEAIERSGGKANPALVKLMRDLLADYMELDAKEKPDNKRGDNAQQT